MHTTSVCYFQPFNNSLYILHLTAINAHHICMLFSAIKQFPLYTALNSHYCTPHQYVIFSHSTVLSIYCTKQPLQHTTSVCYFQPFNTSLYILHFTATNSHHISMLFSSINSSLYILNLTATTAHQSRALFSAIQQFPLYITLNNHYCMPYLYVIFSHSKFPAIYCT